MKHPLRHCALLLSWKSRHSRQLYVAQRRRLGAVSAAGRRRQSATLLTITGCASTSFGDRMRPRGEHGAVLDGQLVRRYLTLVKTTVSTKGQLVLPAEIRQQDDIRPGQEFEIERLDRGEYRLVRVAPPLNEGLVDWLLACPEKGYFVRIESESTDTL